MRFRTKTRDTAQGYIKCMPPDIGDPVYGRTGHVTITSLPKFVILIGYQICLAMVLRWGASHAGFAIKGMRATAEL